MKQSNRKLTELQQRRRVRKANFDDKAKLKAGMIVAKLLPGEEVYVSPQWRITHGPRQRLVISGPFMKALGLERGSNLNYWRKPAVPVPITRGGPIIKS